MYKEEEAEGEEEDDDDYDGDGDDDGDDDGDCFSSNGPPRRSCPVMRSTSSKMCIQTEL